MQDQTLPENIANRLRRDILRGKLVPGDSLKERDSAAELGVSRTPMREAIRIVAREGLITLRPARSPIVAVPDVKAVTDDVEVLLAVEKLSAELACARATVAEVDEIAAILKRMDDNFDTMDPLDMFEIDMSFHSAIAKASHNEPLAEIHGRFLARLWRSRFLAAMKRRNRASVIKHHTGILAALRKRDTVAIRKAISIHLDQLTEDIVQVIRDENELREQRNAKTANDLSA
ncbi:transcriptional regulator, GntR family [Cognatiyoonia koreensis]|uniref:Transcriptional regulator, GntR family n=1 Tax=Cognatiyoonia koreensis TaxID=364200 RepID=A0A1I0QXT2_9RHOB|nr:GntR family transcriptional regulator [Cognatiyoonia koreensis]SEW32543.1 transcriptional regulator, GntR family [Cognatiyoonia koreensis]